MALLVRVLLGELTEKIPTGPSHASPADEGNAFASYTTPRDVTMFVSWPSCRSCEASSLLDDFPVCRSRMA
jgi:hypothetical protein